VVLAARPEMAALLLLGVATWVPFWKTL